MKEKEFLKNFLEEEFKEIEKELLKLEDCF